MSDKKEIATLSIKISVDSTDLDKLEAQLKRIAGLMVRTGLKEPAKGGFVIDPYFGVNDGQVFINSAFITSTTISDAMQKAAKEGARRGAAQARFELTTGINDNHEQSSAIAKLDVSEGGGVVYVDRLEAVPLSKAAKATIASISESISHEESEFDKYKQQVEANFNQLQSSFMSIQNTMADSDKAITESLRQINLKLCGRTVR